MAFRIFSNCLIAVFRCVLLAVLSLCPSQPSLQNADFGSVHRSCFTIFSARKVRYMSQLQRQISTRLARL